MKSSALWTVETNDRTIRIHCAPPLSSRAPGGPLVRSAASLLINPLWTPSGPPLDPLPNAKGRGRTWLQMRARCSPQRGGSFSLRAAPECADGAEDRVGCDECEAHIVAILKTIRTVENDSTPQLSPNTPYADIRLELESLHFAASSLRPNTPFAWPSPSPPSPTPGQGKAAAPANNNNTYSRLRPTAERGAAGGLAPVQTRPRASLEPTLHSPLRLGAPPRSSPRSSPRCSWTRPPPLRIRSFRCALKRRSNLFGFDSFGRCDSIRGTSLSERKGPLDPTL
eukprot:763626-Prorocentrum_minimum.AAC.2